MIGRSLCSEKPGFWRNLGYDTETDRTQSLGQPLPTDRPDNAIAPLFLDKINLGIFFTTELEHKEEILKEGDRKREE